jgi:hypothetical protein
MIPETILIDIFLYFARFPKREGIKPLFNVGNSNIPGYSELKQKIEEMPEHSLTNINNYIFAPNMDAIKARVNNICNDYLFVDFGEIECGTDSSNRMYDYARLAVTVAYRLSDFTSDLIEQALAFNSSLSKLAGIRNTMISDQRCRPWLKDISKNHTFIPFISKELSSVGWTMLFNREGYDSFGAKAI